MSYTFSWTSCGSWLDRKMCHTGTSTMSERWNGHFLWHPRPVTNHTMPSIDDWSLKNHLIMTCDMFSSVITSNYCRWTLIFTRHLAWTRSTSWGSSRRHWRLMATSLSARSCYYFDQYLTFQNLSHRLATSRWPWRRCLSRLTWPPMTWLLTCWTSMRWEKKPLSKISFAFS